MTIKTYTILSLLSIVSLSCIDRDTIIGTGLPEPARIIGVGGNLQTGAVGTTLPTQIMVKVLDDRSKPVRNVRVEFVAPKKNASFGDTVSVTDLDGIAKTTVTLGNKVDSIVVHAVVPGIIGSPVVFKFNAVTSGADGISIVSGNGQVAVVGDQLSQPLVVNVVDKFGNPVSGMNVVFTPSAWNGSISPSVVATDTFGDARSFWTLDTLKGIKKSEARIAVSQASYVTFTAWAKAGIAAKMQRRSEDTIFAIHEQLIRNAVDIKLWDAYTNVDSGVTVSFKVTAGDGSIVPSNTRTGSDGTASADYTSGLFDTSGVVEVTVPGTALKEVIPVRIYRYFQIDSLKSSGGTVTVWWQKNINFDFARYELQRCSSYLFDSTTVTVGSLTDYYATSFADSTAAVGSSPYYRLEVIFVSGYFFYTNIRQVTVQP